MVQQLERSDMIVDRIVAAIVSPTSPIAPGSLEARERRDVQREIDRQIARAVWRAERRARQVPRHVRQSMSYVMKRRRQIAYEISRAVKSLGAGELLANAIAERGAQRYPRDGIVLADSTERADRPRARGDSPRQRAKNPRAVGESPRQRGLAPRQRRAAADLSDTTSLMHAPTPAPVHASATAATTACTELEAPAIGRDLTNAFAAEHERQTRALMADMAAGVNVTGAMTPVQKKKFLAQVRAIQERDRA